MRRTTNIFRIVTIMMIFFSAIFMNTDIVKAESKVLDNGLYRIKNAYSSLYLDIKDGSNADGATTVQALGAENSSQVFKITKETTLMYLLSINKNNKVIEVKDSSNSPEAIVQQIDYTNQINQQWNIRFLSDNTVAIINYKTNGALTSIEGDLSSGGAVTASPYKGTKNQKWILEPLDKKTAPVEKVKETKKSTFRFNISWPEGVLADLTMPQIVFIIAVTLVVLFVLTGYILYAFKVKPDLLIKGKLYYKPSHRDDEKISNFLDLKKKHRSHIVISFNQAYKKADFYITSEGSYDYLLIIEKINEKKLPRFLEGYRFQSIKNNPTRMRILATEPGILYFGEFVYNKHFIVNGSKFESGEISFRYVEE